MSSPILQKDLFPKPNNFETQLTPPISMPAHQEEIDHIDFPIGWNDANYRVVSKTRRNTEEPYRISLKPYFLGFNEVAIDAPTRHPSHRHSSYELIVVSKGPYKTRLNGTAISLDSPQCLLVKPGDLHEVDCETGQRHFVLQFDLGGGSLKQGDHYRIFTDDLDPAMQVFTAPTKEIKPLLNAISTESKSDHRFSSEIQDCLVEHICWILLNHIPKNRLAPAFRKISDDQRFMSRMERFARRNLSNRTSIEELAEFMELSKSTLSKHCSELFGESPGSYLTRYKVNVARELLDSTRKSIKEISFDLGFKNPYHFSRVFKRITGHSPTQQRETPSLDNKP
ncbi:AraC family transcriptional regulator [Opitutia bacterium ISCC 51]|nr:AraC family transcriptional regulator [Opitutae bacterium ISCC 51]QXD27188.1 AraC family transcriptional regulator [Opitutae bacterium ISCC 52]